MKSIVELAREIATNAHDGQFRRDGLTPYICHPESVASRVGPDEQMQAAAWLHDVIEDTSETSTSLLEKGIPHEVVTAVGLLTHGDDTPYPEYLKAIKDNAIACQVKIADMLSNLADNPSNKQIRKYAAGLLVLVPEKR